MATIKPFRALRPVPEKAERVSSAPYDVMHAGEVRRTIYENPLSFLRITRTEAEFADNESPDPSMVFERSRGNLQRFIEQGILFTESAPSLYVYRLVDDDHVQTGVVGCCSLDEYESGLIKKHEKTRPDKVRDRTEHLLAVRAQTGLILLAFRGTDAIRELLESAVKTEPIYDFQCDGDVRHTFWRIESTGTWVEAFADVPSLYIADGHHRVESADLARKQLDEARSIEDESNYVLAGVFPAEDLRILAYNRVVTSLNGLSEGDFLAQVSESFFVSELGEPEPQVVGEIAMYLGKRWYNLRSAVNYVRAPDPVDALDVSVLHNFILSPILGIQDERTDERLRFIGGKESANTIKKLVDQGHAKVGFSLFPTSMESMLVVSDRDEIMPPKSTWFDPKLKDGILIHLI